MSDGPFLRPGEALRDLKTLEALEERPDISQRDLAARLGIAVGLTNACLKTMARKGWIKIKRVNRRNITYHLTAAGISEKARLSVQYAETTIGFYRHAKDTVSQTLGALQALGASRIVILGATDLAEIIGICSAPYEVQIVAIADDGEEGQERLVLGMKIVATSELPEDGFDALIVADTETYDGKLAELKKLARGRLIAWPLESRIESSEEVVA